jgi:hypothetical protein
VKSDHNGTNTHNEWKTDSEENSNMQPKIKSRDSDWLLAGRPRDRSSSSREEEKFDFSMLSRPALGSTQPPIQWIPQALSPGVKRPEDEVDHS